MTAAHLLFVRLYTWLVSFYPRRFQQEFRLEMQTVFEQALLEASASRRADVFIMHELRDFPVALLHAYLHERRLKNMPISSEEKPIRWWGVLAGIGVFLVPIVFELGGENSNITLAIIFRIGFLALMLGVFLFGIFKGLARWCLPTLGFVLGILWMYAGLQLVGPGLAPWLEHIVQGSRVVSRYIGQAIMGGVFWVPLLLILVIFVLIFFLLPPLRPLYRRIRNDWTLVSLTLYGAILFALFINWDEYTRGNIFVAACYLFLALGAAGYLLSKKVNFRITWLLGGAALAMLTMAVGKFILVPLQDWPQWFQWHSPETERWFESLGSLIELVWILLILLAPAVLNLFPPSIDPVTVNPDLSHLKIESSTDSVSPL